MHGFECAFGVLCQFGALVCGRICIFRIGVVDCFERCFALKRIGLGADEFGGRHLA